jgi:hypothetical protein
MVIFLDNFIRRATMNLRHILFHTLIFPCFLLSLLLLPSPTYAWFDDLGSPHGGNYGQIDKIYSEGFIEGYPDNTFRGDNPWTRYEAAMVTARIRFRMFYEIQSLNPLAWEMEVAFRNCPNENPFPDVEENHWAYDAIEYMQLADILRGYPDGSFQGNRSITRAEVASILNALYDDLRFALSDGEWPVPDESAYEPLNFTGLPEDHWAYEIYQRLSSEGIMCGYPDGTARLDRTMTRYEMAIVMERMWDRLIYEIESSIYNSSLP